MLPQAHPRHVPIASLSPERFASVYSTQQYEALSALIARARDALEGHVVWNVNSTAQGGGVVELLRSLLPYVRGAGVAVEWLVIDAQPDFFTLTKRLHNRLHGDPGDGGPLGAGERSIYEKTLAANAWHLASLIRAGDVVILHDPQTAGLAGPLKRLGATVIWRSHVGTDVPNALAREAWEFLGDYVLPADAYVFSRQSFAWDILAPDKIALISPTIDAFSPKNQSLSPWQVRAILSVAGLVVDGDGTGAKFSRLDGSPGYVRRKATVIEDGPLTKRDRVIAQVARWDRLKDPVGVMRGFAQHIAGAHDVHLLLVGPVVAAVADDPEGPAVWAEAQRDRRELSSDLRKRVHLACLPMDDVDENAAIVNAVQRHAELIVQKSFAEGFGLAVAEAMWKSRPVVASRVGGIQDQIVDGHSGILLDDPHDLGAFGRAVHAVLSDRTLERRLGAAAHERVRSEFLGPRELGQYFNLIADLLRQSGEEARRHTAQV